MIRSSSFTSKRPLLYLIATPLGNLGDFSARAITTLKDVALVACEDTRVSGKLLMNFDIKKPLISCREHNEEAASIKIIATLQQGASVAYMSDAGYPGISDPGARLVANVLASGFDVSTIGGSSAFLNALVASGLPSDHFYFHGFLPAKANEQKQVLQTLAALPFTLIFYEAPHRAQATLTSLLKSLGPRPAVIARELTKIHEEFIRGSLEELASIPADEFRGEIVLLIGGAEVTAAPIDEDHLINLISEQIKNGQTLKASCALVANVTGTKKNYLYQLFLNKKS